MHSRRSRPTLRLLAEDLTAGWDSPYPQRLLADGNHEALHPLSELPHPIIAKATESFGPNPGDDNFVGPIASSTKLRLMEIKIAQWRGGVWKDPNTGVHWLVVAGLAKGEHQDRKWWNRVDAVVYPRGTAWSSGMNLSHRWSSHLVRSVGTNLRHHLIRQFTQSHVSVPFVGSRR